MAPVDARSHRTRVGPGFLITAAFIGPGTVTACSLAGAGFGLTLLWVLVLAVAATILLQEMSARLTLTSGAGLTESLIRLPAPWGRLVAWLAALVVLAGVLAFEAGNLSGAGLGLGAVTGTAPEYWTGLSALAAAALLAGGRYALVERVLMVAVGLMALAFCATAVAVAPRLPVLLSGLLLPRLPDDAALTALALVGTTIVPYNIYLHAGAVRERWSSPAELPRARRDLIVAVALGGLISIAIVVTASAALDGATLRSGADMAGQLEPLLGDWARVLFGIGLATAGLTSAITAPLAAGYIVAGLTGRDADLRAGPMRAVLLGCVGIGTLVALMGIQPVRLILFAQAANGFILPIIAVTLLIALNDRRLGTGANGRLLNAAGAVIVLLCTLLATRSLLG